MPKVADKPAPPEYAVNPAGWPPCPRCKGRVGLFGYRAGRAVICYSCQRNKDKK